MRPHLDCGDILLTPFIRLESIQYNAPLTITGAIRGNFQGKTLSRTRLRVTAIQKIVSKTISLLENNKKMNYHHISII